MTDNRIKNGILMNNPGVDKEIVLSFEKLESQLKKLGVDIKPKFSLEHPLGGNMLHLYKADRKQGASETENKND